VKNIGKKIGLLYDRLWDAYGPQGWWPVTGRRTGSRAVCDADGYHVKNYVLPATPAGRFEVAVGAVLTQNTAWTNVRSVIGFLKKEKYLHPQKILAADLSVLGGLIRSSGYYNEKAKKLKQVAALLSKEKWLQGKAVPSREKLLATWGIGEETADSILLYAFHRPFFVVDAYTRRLLGRLGWLGGREPYHEIQAIFHRRLPGEAALFNEFHALIVEHAKQHCLKNKPLCGGCPVRSLCRRFREDRSGKREQ
jgi:endonuclease-3 related protein